MHTRRFRRTRRSERLKLNGGTLRDRGQPQRPRPAKLVIGIEECEESIPRIGESFLLSLSFSDEVGHVPAADGIPPTGLGLESERDHDSAAHNSPC